jgi:hypothetical protein
VSPISPSSQLATALAPRKLRKDGIRLGLIAAISIIYTLLFEQPVFDVLLIVVNSFGVLVGTLALIFACFAVRQYGRAALIALAVYGACTAGHVAAILLLLRN